MSDGTYDDFAYQGSLVDGSLVLNSGDALWLKARPPAPYFGAVFLELEVTGSCDVALGNQTFAIDNDQPRLYRHQVMLHRTPATFRVTSRGTCTIKHVSLKAAKY